MSMELYILSDQTLASIGDWQRAIDAGGHALRLSETIPLSDVRGALPVLIDGKPTAFECTPWDVDDVINESPEIQFGRRWKHALALRWGGDIDAGVAAYAAAASYAKATDGVILDCEEGKIITSERAGEIAGEIDASRAAIEAAVRKATEQFRK